MTSVQTRWLLGSLLAFGALNAFFGGVYGLAGAQGVPTEWLARSPFSDYTVPSLFLLVVVGGSLFAAAWAVLGALPSGRLLALTAGTILLAWIAAEILIIGPVSFLQPWTVAGGLAVLFLALQLPRRRTV